MIRGTTPPITFKLPFNTSIVKDLYITFSQNDTEVLTLEKDDCTLADNVVSARLTQKQTLQLNHKAIVEIQLRILTEDDMALASNIIKSSVGRILKDGEI